MSRRTAYPAGGAGWVAHLGPDVEGSRRFYAAVLGWDFTDVAPADTPPFYLATVHDDPVASLTGPVPEATWIVAVSVLDLDEARRAAVATGGTAPGESVDIPTLGRFHRLHDPAGAEVHAVQPLPARPAGRFAEVGAWSASRLGVDDPASVAAFYRSVFAWESETADAETSFTSPGGPGDVAFTAHSRPGAASWVPEFLVADVDGAVQAATSAGGQVMDGPTAYGVLLADPGGARFSLRS